MADEHIRVQLDERKAKLVSAIQQTGGSDHLARLLREVDDALGKVEKGTYGLCETCGEAIEEERLAIDPLIRNCLDHLSTSEQRMLEHDLDLAYQVQSALLPKQGLTIGAWTLTYHYEPAGPVSGDYLDIVQLGEDAGSFLFLLGDVTGKGVAAAILMSQLHAIFRTLSRSRLSVGELLPQANRLFCEGTTSRYFATLACGRMSSDGELDLTNAGHCAPVVLRSEGLQTIAPTALPLGMFCDGKYASTTLHTKPGDRIFLYTDGLVEARNSRNELYGEERLLSLLERQSKMPPKELLKTCLEDLNAFRAGAPKIDDLAIMLLSRT